MLHPLSCVCKTTTVQPNSVLGRWCCERILWNAVIGRNGYMRTTSWTYMPLIGKEDRHETNDVNEPPWIGFHDERYRFGCDDIIIGRPKMMDVSGKTG
jgi:hypothetical protein